MFRRWPFFQRLLSWTKPFAPVERDSPAYERYDWNCAPRRRARRRGRSCPTSWTGRRTSRRDRRWSRTSRRSPSGPATADPLRLPLDGDAPRGRPGRRRASSSRRPTASTAPGSLVFAVGVAEPYSPATPGIELAAHYADTRPAETYAGRRVFIMGKQNSGFELATGPPAVGPPDRPLLAVAGQAVGQHAVARRRPGALRPAVRGPRPRRRRVGPRRVDRRDRPRRRRLATRSLVVPIRPSDGGEELAIEVDEVISATGLRDAAAGPAGPRRDDVRPGPAAGPDAVLGERDGARDLLRGHDRPGLGRAEEARHAGELRRGPRRALQRPGPGRPHRPDASGPARPARPPIARRPTSSTRSSASSTTAPELWHQRAYLAKVISLDPARRARATRASCRSPRSSTRSATTARATRSRSPSRRTGAARSTRSSTSAAAAGSRSGPIEPGRAPPVRHAGHAGQRIAAILAEAARRPASRRRLIGAELVVDG